MRKFSIQNLSDVDLNVAIEPWADEAIIPPGELVNFEYSDEEDAEVQFAVTGAASAIVAFLSNKVRIHRKDRIVEYGADAPRISGTSSI